MKIFVIISLFIVSCSSLVKTDIGKIENSHQDKRDSESSLFVGYSYKCMGHFDSNCRWTTWPHPEIEEFYHSINQKNKYSKLIFKKKKIQGISLWTILTLGLVPSNIIFEYSFIFVKKSGEKKSYKAIVTANSGLINNFRGGTIGVDYLKHEKEILKIAYDEE